MRRVTTILLGLSLATLLGCAASTSTTETETTVQQKPARNITIEGSGVTELALKMPGMT